MLKTLNNMLKTSNNMLKTSNLQIICSELQIIEAIVSHAMNCFTSSAHTSPCGTPQFGYVMKKMTLRDRERLHRPSLVGRRKNLGTR